MVVVDSNSYLEDLRLPVNCDLLEMRPAESVYLFIHVCLEGEGTVLHPNDACFAF